MSEKEDRPISSFSTPLQSIHLPELPAHGLIIDIGGGGEGLVSRIGEARVCAVDINMNEIREAQIHGSAPQWILCDGRALCFQNEVFDTATMWFSLDYMNDWKTKHAAILEAHRTLKPAGTISVLSSRITCVENRFVLKLLYSLPDGTVGQTGYGVKGNQGQTVERTSKLLRDLGFRPTEIEDNEHWFHIEAVKERSPHIASRALQKLKVGTQSRSAATHGPGRGK
jgi:SAM-dependent methyltransferase